jgi:predicted transcriptional regulator
VARITTIRLEDDVYEQLRTEAFRRKTSMSRLISYALFQYFSTGSDDAD